MVNRDPPPVAPDFVGEIGSDASQANAAERERSVQELKRRLSRPKTFQRLAVEDAFDAGLPAVPSLPRDAFDQADLDSALFDAGADALAQSSLAGLSATMASKDSATEFFGVKASGRRIVIVVNTSASVVRKASRLGYSIERIQDEAAKLIDGLESGSAFGIVQFSQGARVFSDQLAPALKRNKRAASEWVKSELKGNPPIVDETLLGHEAAIHAAMSLRPDLVFIVTDGVLNRRVRSKSGYAYPTISYDELIGAIDDAMRENGVNPRVHVVGFELSEENRAGMQRLTQRFGGSLRAF